MSPKSWQVLLDELSNDPKSYEILDKISKDRRPERLIETCLYEDFYRGKLLEWIRCQERVAKWSKSSLKASSFRIEGNKTFQAGNNKQSLALYTQSVIHAPYESEELSLALGNRSAVLYHLEAYQDCLKDIDLALKHAYPKSLHYKLYLRRGRCYIKLRRFQEAIKPLETGLESLNSLPEESVGKKSSLLNDLRSALSLAKSQETDASASEEPSIQIPSPVYGESKTFQYASAALDLRFSEDKGRHVVANRDIQMGDVLFVEKPFALVVLPDQYQQHCHHCCATFLAPIPCSECTTVLYCSDSCKIDSWNQYHQAECHAGLNLLHSVGIAHLGLRMFLKFCPSFDEWKKACKEGNIGDIVRTDRYLDVYHLMPHLEDMQAEDLIQYTLTAAMLTLYLTVSTELFRNAPSDNKETLCKMGGIILRHISQLVCNAHAITKLDTTPPEQEDQQVVTERQMRTATAIYPSASMMNHSCDPSIINSFYNETLIVRACKDIPCGGEVFNCYGPHFRRMGIKERQELLKSQYFFTCTCGPCSNPVEQDFQERFSALQCSYCAGPLLQTQESAHQMTCSNCRRSQDYSSLVESVFKAHAQYSEGCHALALGDIKEAVNKFKTCWLLRQKCLYRSNRDLTECADQIAKCYATLGEYDKSVEFLLKTIPAVEEQFGFHSIELANELQKVTDVMLCDLQQEVPGTAVFIEKHKKTTEYVQRAKQILELHYGKWNSALCDILAKEQQLQDAVK